MRLIITAFALLVLATAPLIAAHAEGEPHDHATVSPSPSSTDLIMRVEPMPHESEVRQERVVFAEPEAGSTSSAPATGFFTGTSSLLYLLVAAAFVVIIAAYIHVPDTQYRK